MAETRDFIFPDGDFLERLADLAAAVDAALEDERQESGSTRPLKGGESHDSTQLKREWVALKAKADEDARGKKRAGTLRAPGRAVWRRLKHEHPARTEGAPKEALYADQIAGVNTETIADDLVFACLSEPKFESREQFDEWLDETLTEAEFRTLLGECWALVSLAPMSPKAPAAWQTPNSGTN